MWNFKLNVEALALKFLGILINVKDQRVDQYLRNGCCIHNFIHMRAGHCTVEPTADYCIQVKAYMWEWWKCLLQVKI